MPAQLGSSQILEYQARRGDRFQMKNARSGRFAKLKLRLLIASLFICALPYGQSSTPITAAQRPLQRPGIREQNAGARPRLVLLIVVDQFRYDYLARFGDLFGENGFRRLLRQGASWTEANYDHMPTYTAPGHAVLMTGAWPSQTGIVANEWYEQSTGRKVRSATDESTNMLGGKAGEKGYSPRRLLCSTVGDELRLADNDRSKVIGISAKYRSAIFPVGRHANAAYWFSDDTGNMTSSTYYFDQMPAWVTRFNNKRLADGWFGARWDRLLPEAEYLKRAGKDDVPWENLDKTSNDTNFFPHIVTGGSAKPSRPFFKALVYTPFSNDLLLSFAEEAITNEKLGDDNDTDVVTVSFSANDYVGHRFGPNSQEVMDMSLRVDRQIGKLLDFVDARIGLQNTIVIFTADHGASPVPELAALQNLPGRRSQKAEMLKLVEDGLKAKYGRKDRPATDYVRSFTNRQETEKGLLNGNFYLNRAALQRDGIDLEECERVVGELAMQMPGVARFFTRTQLESGSIPPGDDVARRVLHGFYSPRSGDVILVFEPYSILFDPPDDPTDPRSSATHGSPYSYDTHVPLIIMGRSFRAGKYTQAATPADLAPTLAHILNVQAPSCSVGRVLAEALGNGQQGRSSIIR
jgi:predicted AlkP superfamily pyrophosphatase or phosphodiesterase